MDNCVIVFPYNSATQLLDGTASETCGDLTVQDPDISGITVGIRAEGTASEKYLTLLYGVFELLYRA